MDIQIRRVAPEESKIMTSIALAAKSYWGYPTSWMQIWTPELTFGPAYFEDNESWAAVAQEEAVGFYTLQEKEGAGWLDNLFIKPEYMGRGIGQTLFAHALTLARQRGYRWMRWESDPNAVGFYEKMGGRRIGERHSRVEDQPRILPIMELEL